MLNGHQRAQMPFSLILALTFLLLALLVGGCGGDTGSSGGGILRAAPAPPDQIVEQFMDAWNAQDYEAMYSLVAGASRDIYDWETFQTRYQLVQSRLQLDGVTYDIDETRIQGQTAAVTYDATLASPIFAEIEDMDRTMRLILTDGGWQIAWTPMDILNNLAGDATLSVQQRFPQRANIYDRNGLPLAEQNGTIVALSASLQDMFNQNDCIDLLAELLLRDRRTLVTLFTNYNADTIFSVGEMDAQRYFQNADRLSETCGINNNGAFRKVAEYEDRLYHGGGAVAHVTGYIGRIPAEQVPLYQSQGYSESDLVGRSAVELAFEPYLAGQPERFLRLIEPGGAVLRELGGSTGSDPAPVTLTIDRELQYQTAKALNDAFNYALPNWGALSPGGAAVVMDVNTGAILALASYPTFDPGLFNPGNSYFNADIQLTQVGNDPRQPLSNKAVQEQYTPGSIYKIITLVAAAQEDIYPREQIFDCTLTWNGSEYGDTLAVREDWRVADGRDAAGPLNMTQALTTSCNPFFWEMGGLMYRRSPNMLVEYSEMLGLGQPVGLSIPELEIGNILGPEAPGSNARPNAPEQAINNAIGQGDVKVTALQFVQAVAALANRGTLYEPYIVQQVGGADGAPEIYTAEPRIVRELPLRDDVYDVIFEGMCDVPIDPTFGTGIYAFVNKQPYTYTTCGKTGTAQAGAPGSSVPPHAWYASFAPADNPQIAMVVVVPNSREGSEVSAHISRRIYDHYFNAQIAPYPDWWREDYIPLQQPAGVASG